MERRAFVLALALTLPLALYTIPYAYAATQSTYVVSTSIGLKGGDFNAVNLMCSGPSDSTLHFAYGNNLGGTIVLTFAVWLNSAGSYASTGQTPNGYQIAVHDTGSSSSVFFIIVEIACQSPITVAGIGVPEFGSLYVAIALGAVVYFMLSRRFSRRPTLSAPVKA